MNTPASTPVDTSTSPSASTSASTNKFTFYFTDEQLERLDTTWITMRGLAKGSKKKVNKSRFIRYALERLLADFEKNPEKVTQELLAHTDQAPQ